MAEATRRPSRWRVFAPDTAGAIYGTIAAMAVIAGAARDPSHGKALGLTVATLFVGHPLLAPPALELAGGPDRRGRQRAVRAADRDPRGDRALSGDRTGVALLVLHQRAARRRARAAAVAEALALLHDLGPTAPAGGPLADRGGVLWVELPERHLG